MRRLAITPLLFLIPLALKASAEDGLSAASLAKIKDATVFVLTEKGSGSGVVFKKTGKKAWILTCAHVVGEAKKTEVILNCGTKAERKLKAEVVGVDPARDLACLTVEDDRLPAPLELGGKTEVKETDAVFVVGFPFGDLLRTSKVGPNISVSKASVSSLRTGPNEEVVALQLSGDVNPGNSGGPVVTAKGKVAGIAAAKMRDSGMAFAIPPEEIQPFLDGGFDTVSAQAERVGALKVKLSVSAQMRDPLRQAQPMDFNWVWRDSIKEFNSQGEDGKPKKGCAAMRSVPFKVDAKGNISATVELTRNANDPLERELIVQCRCTRAKGGPSWTADIHWFISFDKNVAAIITDAPRVKVVGDVRPPAAGGVGPSLPPPAAISPRGAASIPVKPVVPPALDFALSLKEEIEVVAKADFRGMVSDMILSPDRKHLYVLELAECKVVKFRTDTLVKVGETRVADDAVAMALGHDGAKLYVASRRGCDVKSPERTANPVRFTGRIEVLDIREMKREKEVLISMEPLGIAMTNTDVAVVSSTFSLVLVDVKNGGSGLAGVDSGGASQVLLSPDQKCVYFVMGDYRCHCALFQTDPKMPHYLDTGAGRRQEMPLLKSAGIGSDANMGKRSFLSPDGRWMIGMHGGVLKMPVWQEGFPEKMNAEKAEAIDPWMAAACASGCRTFFTSSAKGFVKAYEIGEKMEPVRAFKIKEGRCAGLLLDPDRGILFALLVPAAAWLPREGESVMIRDLPSCSAPAELVAFSVSVPKKAKP